MSTTIRSKSGFLGFLQTLIPALQALDGADNVQAKGQTYTKAQMLAPLLAYQPLPGKTQAAKTAYNQALEAEDGARAAAVTMTDEVIVPYLRTRFGKDSPVLETYGIAPQQPAQKSAATKAAAAQKRATTRKALGTLGTQQKKAAKKVLAAKPAEAPATPPASPAQPATPVTNKS